MKERWKNRKMILNSASTSMTMAHVSWLLGAVFAVLGVIGEAINVTLGLAPTSWLLLAIAAFVASIPQLLGWHLAVYLDAIETKSKKEE